MQSCRGGFHIRPKVQSAELNKSVGATIGRPFKFVGRCLGAAVSNKIKLHIVGATINRSSADVQCTPLRCKHLYENHPNRAFFIECRAVGAIHESPESAERMKCRMQSYG